VNPSITKRLDGKYQEILGETWLAEYLENSDTGLWEVEIFRHDVPEWRETGYDSLEEASQAAHDYYDRI
jgi:hypothetical protein